MKPRRIDHSVNSQSEAASRSVARAVAILDHLYRAGRAASISELSLTLRIPRSSAYQIVRPLVAAGLVERTGAAGSIALGRRLYEFGLAYSDRSRLLQEALPVVEAVRDETGETAQLAVLDHDEVLVVLKADGHQPVHVATRLGMRIPVNWSAAGRLLLSDLSDTELRSRLPGIVAPSPSGRATVDVAKLVREIGAARANGAAVQLNQSIQNIGAVAAPVIDSAGRCIAALSIAVPVHRLRGARRQRLVETMIRAAGAISERLEAAALAIVPGQAVDRGGDGRAPSKKRDSSRR